MRLLARVNLCLPWHGAGAEVYLHCVLREMVRRGHEAIVVARGAKKETVLDGVEIRRLEFCPKATDADVVITQLDDTEQGLGLAAGLRPAVAIFHNHRQPTIYQHTPRNTALGVWNSFWTRDEAGLEKFAAVDLVAPPPVDPADYELPDYAPHEYDVGRVTLINLQPEKGVAQATALAEAMPDTDFLFVVGGYGRQVRPKLHNVDIVGPVPWNQMRHEVYARTRVLLVPSDYESYGRVAVEACHAGIPVLAHPTGGLVEALGPNGAGVFAHRDLLEEWVRVLRCLEEPESYRWHSNQARARAAELDPTITYDAWEHALMDITSTNDPSFV